MSNSEGQELEAYHDNGGQVIQQITRGELETQMELARKYPRDLVAVKEEVRSLATLDQETAQSCFYSLKRGGKTIGGNSVRLAEILVSSYGNLKAGSRPVSINLNRGIVTVQGFCMDVQKNTVSTIEKERKIQKKRGADTYDEDMINLAVNSACAIAYRDAVFKVVPQALIKPVLGDIKEAARGKGTLEQKRKKVVERLVEMGVDAPRIYAAVEINSIDDIDLPILDVLIGMGTALKDGEYTKDDLFPPVKKAVPKAKVDGEDKKEAADSVMGQTGAGAESEQTATEKQAEDEKKRKADAAKVLKVYKGHGISEDVLIAWTFANKHSTAEHKKLHDLPLDKIKMIGDNTETIVKEILPPNE